MSDYKVELDPNQSLPSGTNTLGSVGVFFSPANPTVSAAFSGSVAAYFSPSNPSVNVSNASIPVTGTFWQATQPVSGTVTANAGTGTLSMFFSPATPSVAVTNNPVLGAGTSNIGDVDVLTIAAGDNNIGNVDVVTLPALIAGTANIGDVDVLTLPALVAGTANIGDVDVLTLPALVAGTANIGDVDVLTLPALVAGTANIGDVDVLTLPNVTLAAGTNTNEVVGDAAHDAPIAGNPVRKGLRAVNADITAVGTGDTVDAIADLVGKQIVLLYAIPENDVDGNTTLTATSDVAIIAAGGAGIRNYITSFSASNTSATGVRVDFKDGTAIKASFFLAASGGGVTHTMPTPMRGTAATAFNAALSAAVTDVRVSAQGYRGV